MVARPDDGGGGPRGERLGGNPSMHERGKSDGPVVPAKLPNKPARAGAEAVEGRGSAKGNTTGATRPGRSAGVSVKSALDRVREAARRDRDACASLARAALRRHDPRQEPSALDAHAGICAGGRPRGRSLPRWAVLCERWRLVGPPASAFRGRASNHPVLRWLKDRRGERQGEGAALIASGGDREDVPESSGRAVWRGRGSLLRRRKA